MIDPSKKILLSNSMSDLLDVCEKRFAFKYLLEEKEDIDYIHPVYFRFGSCFHKILEKTNYNSDLFTTEILDSTIDEFALDHVYDKAKIHKCLLAYYKAHKESCLKVVKTEYYFIFDSFGTIDAIMTDENGWWIIENKTCQKLDENQIILLFKNQQINLYAHHAEDIRCDLLKREGLELGVFKGIKYREVTKAQQKKKIKPETYDEYYTRISDSLYNEITIDVDLLNTKKAKQNVLNKTERVQKIIDKIFDKMGNVNLDLITESTQNCYDSRYKKLCPYFSKCYGKKLNINESFEDLI